MARVGTTIAACLLTALTAANPAWGQSDGSYGYKENEVTPGGSRIIVDRDERANTELQPDRNLSALVMQKYADAFGEPLGVFPDPDPQIVEIELAVFAPNAERAHWVFATIGASNLEMNAPAELPQRDLYTRAEYVLSVAPEMVDVSGGAPILTTPELTGLVVNLARYVHARNTWFSFGHTIPLGQGVSDEVPQTGVMFDESLANPTLGLGLALPEGDAVQMLAVYLIDDVEMAYKLSDGSEALLTAFRNNKLDDVVRRKRDSVVDPTRADPTSAAQ